MVSLSYLHEQPIQIETCPHENLRAATLARNKTLKTAFTCSQSRSRVFDLFGVATTFQSCSFEILYFA